MRWKLFRRKMTISAPRMAVRARVPWPLRAALGFGILAVAAASGVALYEYGRRFTGPDPRELQVEIERLRSQLRELTAERDRWSTLAAARENQIQVEQAAQAQLAKQVGTLEVERNRLREDLSFFESLLPASSAAQGVVVRSFRVTREGAPHLLRFRLLVQQAGKPESDFVGAVQLQVNYAQGGRAQTLSLPAPDTGPDSGSLALSFRHYQRVEGSFALPEGALVRSVLVRIVAGGKVLSQQSFPV